MRKLIKYLLKYIHWGAIAALVLSYMSVYISPERFWPLAFFGLSYPVLLLLNFAFLALWIFRKNRLFLSTAFILLLGWNYHKSFFRISFREQLVPVQTGGIKVLSYNVRMFNYYEWDDQPQSINDIIRFVGGIDPGIICFQEFFFSGRESFSRERLMKALGNDRDIHLNPAGEGKSANYAGLATFSSHPIINKGAILFPRSRNICIFTDIVWNDDTVRIYNNHLESIRLRKKPSSFIRRFDPFGNEENIEELKDISKRLKNAFIERARQVNVIKEHMNRCPYPLIICGDFNDTPVSYSYYRMKKGLADSFTGSGAGFGNTYRGNFPSYRIDYILHSQDIISSRFQRHLLPHSDHYPVSCTVFRGRD